MKTDTVERDTSRMVGTDGCDYGGATTTLSGYYRWYALVVNTECVITGIVVKDKQGTAKTFAPSWLNVTLSAGMMIPFGLVDEEEIYATSITLSSGSVLLYRD